MKFPEVSVVAFLLRAVVIIAGIQLAGCHRRTEATSSPELAPASVRTTVLREQAHLQTEDVVGTVRAKLRAAIEAKVNARVESLLVNPGQPVGAGEVIAQLDAREIQARLDQAMALREQAARDLERARDLVAKKITTQAEFESALARERVASGSVREAETMLGYTKVLAPFVGVVTRKLVDIGDMAAPGRPLIEMEDPAALRFEADVPESLISRVAVGAKLAVRIGSLPRAIEGLVVEVAPVADPASRTFLVKLDLPAIEGTRSGQFGRVEVPIGESKSIRVSASSVLSRGQMEYVFAVAEKRAQLRIVRVGRRDDAGAEILAGLSSGEVVVTDGAERLRDGQPLNVLP